MTKFFILTLAISLFYFLPITAQNNEPEFIGEVYYINESGNINQLNREIASTYTGFSWTSTYNHVFKLKINGGKAKTRLPKGKTINLIVRVAEDKSDPLTFIKIYRLDTKKKERTTVLYEYRAGGILSGTRVRTENQVPFSIKKYGSSSYQLTLDALKKGEYAILATDSYTNIEERAIVSCFGID